MELILQPQATACFVTGQPFAEDDRVVSYLVQGPALEIRRYDLLAASAAAFEPAGVLACRWVHVFKAKTGGDNAERQLKLTAENLFLTLADPLTEQTEENLRLVRFLALMLERKRLLRPKGTSPDGAKQIYEHTRTKQLFEVPAGDFDPAFFLAVQAQLGLLVGVPAVEPVGAPASANKAGL